MLAPLPYWLRDHHLNFRGAFDTTAETMPLVGVGYEAATNEKGERLIWLRWLSSPR
jgi:hypothetical protein